MTYRSSILVLFLFLLFALGSCDRPKGGTAAKRGTWLYMGEGEGDGKLVHGDVLRLQGKLLIIHNILKKRDTVITLDHVEDDLLLLPIETLLLRTGELGRFPSRLLQLEPPSAPLDSGFILQQPFTYAVDSNHYWASFERTFTGDSRRVRPKAKDFVNRFVDYTAVRPGLEFSEFSLFREYEQPILVISERNGRDYGRTIGVLIDTVGPDFFGGRTFQGPDGNFPEHLMFRTAPLLPDTFTADSFVRAVNTGYSQSHLLIDTTRDRVLGEPKRLPGRSYIDPGDLGFISASFLDDGTVMFLSDDHIILQGGYVLDLDKGILTVSGQNYVTYHVFVDTREGINFTLPVSVVQLRGDHLVGSDNYLRVDVME